MLLHVVENFGQWLRRHRTDLGLTLREVAERTGLSFSYISALERQQPHSITGKDITPTREKVVLLARAVQGNQDEALTAAGYAPSKPLTKPTTLEELAQALETLGIEMPMPYGGFPMDPDGEGFKEIVERIWLDIQMVVNRLNRGRRPPQFMTLTIDDADVANEEVTELQIKRG